MSQARKLRLGDGGDNFVMICLREYKGLRPGPEQEPSLSSQTGFFLAIRRARVAKGAAGAGRPGRRRTSWGRAPRRAPANPFRPLPSRRTVPPPAPRPPGQGRRPPSPWQRGPPPAALASLPPRSPSGPKPYPAVPPEAPGPPGALTVPPGARRPGLEHQAGHLPVPAHGLATGFIFTRVKPPCPPGSHILKNPPPNVHPDA